MNKTKFFLTVTLSTYTYLAYSMMGSLTGVISPTYQVVKDYAPTYASILSRATLVPGVGFITTCWVASKCYDRCPSVRSLGNRNAVTSTFLNILWTPSTNIFFQMLSDETKIELNRIRIGYIAKQAYEKNIIKIADKLNRDKKVPIPSITIATALAQKKLLLLHGPSGVGKTNLMMQLAKQNNLPLWIVQQNEIDAFAPSLDEKTLACQTAISYFGETLHLGYKNIPRVDCMLVFDEFDKIVQNSTGTINRSTISFLNTSFENGPFEYKKHVYIWGIMITNKPDHVYTADISDRAFREFIGFPDTEQRKAKLKNYLNYRLKNLDLDDDNQKKLAIDLIIPFTDSNDNIKMIFSDNKFKYKVKEIDKNWVDESEGSSFRGLEKLVDSVETYYTTNPADFTRNEWVENQITANRTTSIQNLNEYINDAPIHTHLLKNVEHNKSFKNSTNMLINSMKRAQLFQNKQPVASVMGAGINSMRRTNSFSGLNQARILSNNNSN